MFILARRSIEANQASGRAKPESPGSIAMNDSDTKIGNRQRTSNLEWREVPICGSSLYNLRPPLSPTQTNPEESSPMACGTAVLLKRELPKRVNLCVRVSNRVTAPIQMAPRLSSRRLCTKSPPSEFKFRGSYRYCVTR